MSASPARARHPSLSLLTPLRPLAGHKEGRHWDFRNRAASRDHTIQKHARPVAQGGQGLLAPNPKEESAIVKTRCVLVSAGLTTPQRLTLLADRQG